MDILIGVVNVVVIIVTALVGVAYKSKERELGQLQSDVQSNKAAQDLLNKELTIRVEQVEIETHKIRTNYIGKFGEVRLEIRDSIGVLEKSITDKFDKVTGSLNQLNNLIAQQNLNNSNTNFNKSGTDLKG